VNTTASLLRPELRVQRDRLREVRRTFQHFLIHVRCVSTAPVTFSHEQPRKFKLLSTAKVELLAIIVSSRSECEKKSLHELKIERIWQPGDAFGNSNGDSKVATGGQPRLQASPAGLPALCVEACSVRTPTLVRCVAWHVTSNSSLAADDKRSALARKLSHII